MFAPRTPRSKSSSSKALIPTRTERHALAESRRPMGMTRYSLRSENPGMSQPSRGLVLRAIGLDPACTDGVHPERLRQLAREGSRFTAQHLRALSPLRRRATLVATVLDTIGGLTDDGVGLFDRAVARMFRRAETRAQDALLHNARAVNDKVRLLAKLGGALIEARDAGADLEQAVATAIGWDKLARGVAEAERLVRPKTTDLAALAARTWPVLHRPSP